MNAGMIAGSVAGGGIPPADRRGQDSRVTCRAFQAVGQVGAFTLVEMLVVVAIIGILVSLMMPSLHKAIEESRRISCASQFRQINLAFHSYAGDYGGVLPAISNDASNWPVGPYPWPSQWFMMLGPYAGGQWRSGVRPAARGKSIFTCPSAEAGVNARAFDDRVILGIAMSLYLGPAALSFSPPYPSYANLLKDYPKVALITNPSRKILVADGWRYELGSYWGMTNIGDPNDYWCFYRIRHNGGYNILFVDGSIKYASEGEVYERGIAGTLFHNW